MSNRDTTRRRFFQKLGLTIGAAAVIETEALADINPNKYSTAKERAAFLVSYEKWVNGYIAVVEAEKKDRTNLENKQRMVDLASEAEVWQNQIKEYIRHADFKDKYIELSKKLADCITSELET